MYEKMILQNNEIEKEHMLPILSMVSFSHFSNV